MKSLHCISKENSASVPALTREHMKRVLDTMLHIFEIRFIVKTCCSIMILPVLKVFNWLHLPFGLLQRWSGHWRSSRDWRRYGRCSGRRTKLTGTSTRAPSDPAGARSTSESPAHSAGARSPSDNLPQPLHHSKGQTDNAPPSVWL